MLAIGRAYRPKSSGALSEALPLDEAFAKAQDNLEALAKGSDIFAAHLEMLCDPMLMETIEGHISEGSEPVLAVEEACDEICAMFEGIEDEYLRERVSDVRDVCVRLVGLMRGDTSNPYESMPEGSVVVAEEILPSDTARMDMSKVVGFVTRKGSATSHVCIIARTYGIIALTGVEDVSSINDGDLLILDSESGLVAINPSDDVLSEYQSFILSSAPESSCVSDSSPVLVDGRLRCVCANVFNAAEVRMAMRAGAHGVGLFRSEGLFFSSEDGFPSEQMQFEEYRDAALTCGDKPLTIRTLDVGGDKPLPYFPMPSEPNPFLGMRGVRVSLANKDMFLTQLRAVLRAAVYGNVRIMFPMVTSVEEFLQARSCLDEAASQLSGLGVEFRSDIPVGVMIETPSAVFVAPSLAEKADFFSIGTNDLTQYVMAADRGNASVSSLCNPSSEAVMNAISATIEAAHSAGIECCMCGEFAADLSATKILVEMGLDSFSVSVPSISALQALIRTMA